MELVKFMSSEAFKKFALSVLEKISPEGAVIVTCVGMGCCAIYASVDRACVAYESRS